MNITLACFKVLSGTLIYYYSLNNKAEYVSMFFAALPPWFQIKQKHVVYLLLPGKENSEYVESPVIWSRAEPV